MSKVKELCAIKCLLRLFCSAVTTCAGSTLEAMIDTVVTGSAAWATGQYRRKVLGFNLIYNILPVKLVQIILEKYSQNGHQTRDSLLLISENISRKAAPFLT